MLEFEANLEELRGAIKLIERLAAPDFFTQTIEAIGRKAIQLVQHCFDVGADPYGTPWVPLARFRGMPRGILLRSGALYRSFQYLVQGRTLVLYSTVDYAVFAQKGTGGPHPNPQRMFFPAYLMGELPASWLIAFDKTANDMFRHVFADWMR